jgi:hypothetical protein
MKLNGNFREEFSTKSPTLTLLVIVKHRIKIDIIEVI